MKNYNKKIRGIQIGENKMNNHKDFKTHILIDQFNITKKNIIFLKNKIKQSETEYFEEKLINNGNIELLKNKYYLKLITIELIKRKNTFGNQLLKQIKEYTIGEKILQEEEKKHD